MTPSKLIQRQEKKIKCPKCNGIKVPIYDDNLSDLIEEDMKKMEVKFVRLPKEHRRELEKFLLSKSCLPKL